MKVTKSSFYFESGKKLYANRGIVGLDVDTLETFGGYDGEFGICDDLSQEEREDLANYMISKWNEYKDKK